MFILINQVISQLMTVVYFDTERMTFQVAFGSLYLRQLLHARGLSRTWLS